MFRDRPPPTGTLSRHVHELLPIELRHSNVRVILYVTEIIKYKRNVETIAVGNDTHYNQYGHSNEKRCSPSARCKVCLISQRNCSDAQSRPLRNQPIRPATKKPQSRCPALLEDSNIL